MLGIPIRYLLKHPIIGLADLAADPAEVWTAVVDAYVASRERHRPQCLYDITHNWEKLLQDAIKSNGHGVRRRSSPSYGTE